MKSYTVGEAASLLGLTPLHLRRLAERGEVAALWDGQGNLCLSEEGLGQAFALVVEGQGYLATAATRPQELREAARRHRP